MTAWVFRAAAARLAPRCSSNSTPSRWSRRRARPAGTYSALLVVPKAVAPGTHTVTVVCAAPNGTVTTTTATITVSTTATTGYSPRPPIIVAIILLMLGGVCLVARNRLRPQPAKVRSR